MKNLLDSVSYTCSKLVTRKYSTSFSLGIYLLNKRLRTPIYAIYGFVRFADEIVDTLEEFDQRTLLNRFRQDTYRAIEEGISLNPILQSFQMTVNRYGIERPLIDAFFKSMEMDLEKKQYNAAQFKEYILGSAEVVGLMCLRVFCDGDEKEYNRLKPYAMHLGSAYQKVNFLRDLKADYQGLGRTYFPNVDLSALSQEKKTEIETDIERDFEQAYIGIPLLPKQVRLGVYLTFVYYYALFKKIRKTPSNEVLSRRIRIPNEKKYMLLVRAYFKYVLNSI